jgi:hypothetical protein
MLLSLSALSHTRSRTFFFFFYYYFCENTPYLTTSFCLGGVDNDVYIKLHWIAGTRGC